MYLICGKNNPARAVCVENNPARVYALKTARHGEVRRKSQPRDGPKSRGAGCDLSAFVSDAARRFSCSGRRFSGRVSSGVVSQLRNRRRVVFSAAIGFASIFSPHGARCVYFCP
ncbi:hypothetical protein NDU88_005836 [Pleurodeles waltl]|uniref:Uncharacterized protein n=1 Tax=Pleurodeles waltl TaxID=8319 RepID=A0AAV7W950_PLEWA|nr:hypothetical protein NDU88_005836 [Pleurodeles waltl]